MMDPVLPVNVSSGMQKLISWLLQVLRASSGSNLLLLARSSAEMNQLAKYIDRALGRSPYFCRMAYERDPDHFCYTLAVPIPGDEGLAPGDLWIGVVGEATPEEMDIFSDSQGEMDLIAWPDDRGTYCIVQHEVWVGWWVQGEESPTYRPSGVDNEALFEVGMPVGWTPPEPEPPRMSVWERLVSNATNRGDDTAARKKAKKRRTRAKKV